MKLNHCQEYTEWCVVNRCSDAYWKRSKDWFSFS